jgi:hypothetical protein
MSAEQKIATLTETPTGYGYGLKTGPGDVVTLTPGKPTLVDADLAEKLKDSLPDGYKVEVKAGSQKERDALARAAGIGIVGGISGGVAEGNADGDTSGGTTP